MPIARSVLFCSSPFRPAEIWLYTSTFMCEVSVLPQPQMLTYVLSYFHLLSQRHQCSANIRQATYPSPSYYVTNRISLWNTYMHTSRHCYREPETQRQVLQVFGLELVTLHMPNFPYLQFDVWRNFRHQSSSMSIRLSLTWPVHLYIIKGIQVLDLCQ